MMHILVASIFATPCVYTDYVDKFNVAVILIAVAIASTHVSTYLVEFKSSFIPSSQHQCAVFTA